MPIRCLVADDEPLAKILIEQYISQTDGLELASSHTSAAEALDAILHSDVQLAFLDIQMPGLSGLELAEAARKSGVRVVFITAYRDYALDGFRLNALDYLLKPVSFEEFTQTAQRAFDSIPRELPSSMTVRVNYRNTVVEFSNIIYIEGLRDYVKIHLADSRPIITQSTLSAISEMLPSDRFTRIHRSYIVAIDKVKEFSKTSLKLDLPAEGTEITLPIGATYKDSLKL